MNTLLFINKTQFGYRTDYYKYCQYLKEEFDLTFICFDVGRRKLEMEDVNVVYVPWKGPKVMRGLLFLIYCAINLLKHQGLIFIHYFKYCNILKKMFPRKKMILDIRTLSIHENPQKRINHNKKLEKACDYFDHITIISEGLRKKLNVHKDESDILPLGADVISDSNKDFSKINLLYVGTLHGRNISETIKGLDIFLKNSDWNGVISYDIVGDARAGELDKLKKMVGRLGMSDMVTLHGRIPYDELKPFFDKCNVGVSYIPMTDFFDYQPPTKTFEYVLSGMVCMATKTHENKRIINHNNGVLHEDTPQSFSGALKKIILNKDGWDSSCIRSTLKSHTWENIVRKKLLPILTNF